MTDRDEISMKPFIIKRKKVSVAIAAVFACVVAGVVWCDSRMSPLDYPLAWESELAVSLIQNGNEQWVKVRNVSERTVCVDRNLLYGFVIGYPSHHEWIMSQEFSARPVSYREMVLATNFIRLEPEQSFESRLDPHTLQMGFSVYKRPNDGQASYIIYYLQSTKQNIAGSTMDLHYAPSQNQSDLLWANSDHPEI